MKKWLALILAFSFSVFYSQTFKTVTIVQQTSKYLNSGGRAMLGGVSRIPIRVDLPENTVQWYYSFSTSAGESGTGLLNLAVQLGAAATAGPLGGAAAKSLEVPSGSASVDIWLLPLESKDDFVNKNDDKIQYYPDLSEINTRQSVKQINKLLSGSYYLGLRNPSAVDGINITIEVVALVKEESEEDDKGKLYGTMGWKAFEKGELDKCVELSNKALSFNPNLAWVKFNIALVHLVQEKDQCLDEYIDGITTCKKDGSPKNSLLGAIEDITNLKSSKGTLKNMDEIEELLRNELNKY